MQTEVLKGQRSFSMALPRIPYLHWSYPEVDQCLDYEADMVGYWA